MHTRDCSAAASKADQLAQTLQDACMQAISEVQRLSAQLSATMPASEQRLQRVSKAGPLEPSRGPRSTDSKSFPMDARKPVAEKLAPAAPLQLQLQPHEANCKPAAGRNNAAKAVVQGPRRRERHSMAKDDHGSNQGVCQPADTPECTALQPNAALKQRGKRRRALAEHDCKQSTQKAEETPQNIQDTTPDLQATPWQTKASARKPVTQHAQADTQASRAEKTFKRRCTPSKTAADSSSIRQASPSSPIPSAIPEAHPGATPALQHAHQEEGSAREAISSSIWHSSHYSCRSTCWHNWTGKSLQAQAWM